MTAHLPRTALLLGLIIAGAVARLTPHPPNVSPVAALALLGGATLAAPWSFAFPGAAMLASDIVLGFDSLPITLSVYGSFFITVCLGRWLRSRTTILRMILASLGGSVLFYLVTNAAVWWFSGMYPQTFDGLVLSYTYALPFFRHTLVGDLAYTTVLIGTAFLLPRYAARAMTVLSGAWRSRKTAHH